MSANDLSPPGDAIDLANLYRQETYTDLGLGSIQSLSPVKADGSPDPSRTPIFMGTAQIMTQHGPLPVQCEIEARDLKSACEAFPGAVKDAVNKLIRQAREFERERHGGIVIPRGGKLELP